MKLLNAAAIATALLIAWPVAAAAAEPLVRHDIEAALDPESGRLTVVDRLSVEGRDELTFRIADWLTIEQVERDGRAIDYGHQNGVFRVGLPDTSKQEVVVRLSGEVPALPPEPPRGRTGGALAGPEGSYFPAYAGWIPVTDDEWVTYRLRVEVPPGQRAVATGRLVEESASDEAYMAVFRSDVPSELPSLFVGPYEVSERQANGIRLRTYFHEDIAPFAEQYLETASGYLQGFAETIGAYPYDDFHIISSPLPVGLGFPNLTYIGRMIVPLPFMQGRSLAHEVLHNWWGNGVAVDYRSGNWAEGLTTYMADHAVVAEKGEEAAREMRLGWLRDYAALPASRDVPVTAFVAKRHQASQVIGYNKVAHIFHMLKQELGEQTFVDGLRLFWSRHKFSSAAWSEIQASFEAAAGRDLGGFFAQWLDRAGAPRVELIEVKTHDRGDGQRLAVTLGQAQPAYRLRLPIEIETASGTVRHVALLEQPEQSFEFALPATPLSVRVDPSFDVFRHLLPGESPPILRDLMLSQRVNALVLSENGAFAEASRALLRRMVDPSAKLTEASGLDLPAGPSLVIGEQEGISQVLDRAGLSGIPAQFEGASAAAWATKTTGGDTVLLVSATSAEALSAVIRSLPHYGRQSYVVFYGNKASKVGLWEAKTSPLSISLSN